MIQCVVSGDCQLFCANVRMSCVCILLYVKVQKTPDTILIEVEEDISGGMPAVG